MEIFDDEGRPLASRAVTDANLQPFMLEQQVILMLGGYTADEDVHRKGDGFLVDNVQPPQLSFVHWAPGGARIRMTIVGVHVALTSDRSRRRRATGRLSGEGGRVPSLRGAEGYHSAMRQGDFADGAAVHAMVLMAQITRRLSAITPPALDGVRYSNTMVRILIALDERGGTTPSELGAQLGLDRSIVSRTVTQLHTRGVVSRRVDVKDRRYVRLRLSAKGKRSIDEYISSITSAATGIAPLVGEVARTLDLPDPVDGASSDASLFRSLDKLAAVGSRTVTGFVGIERIHGVSHWTQRFVLWVAQDHPGATSDDIASSLNLEPAQVLAAVDQLQALGLATIHAGVADTDDRAGAVTLTDPGVALVAAESALFCEQVGELIKWAHRFCQSAQPARTDAS